MRSKDSSKRVSSATKRKNLNGLHTEVITNNTRPKSDAIIVSKNAIKFQIENSGCLECHMPLSMKLNQQKVYYCDYDVVCKNCDVVVASQPKDVFVIDDNGVVKSYCKKTLGAVYATMFNGRGQKALGDFNIGLTFNPVCKTEFHEYKAFIIETTKNVTQDHLTLLSTRIFEFYRDVLDIHPDKDGILNVTVMFDGTWKTRGFNSTMGAGVLIEAYTTTVLDFEVFCRKCNICSIWKSKLDKNKITKDKYDEWKSSHGVEYNNCHNNWPNSAQSMETEAAKRIWNRSMDKLKMRYTVLICDGDTDCWKAVKDLNLYDVTKLDCVLHVGKRIYRNLLDVSTTKIIKYIPKPKKGEQKTKGCKKEVKDMKTKSKKSKAIKPEAKETTQQNKEQNGEEKTGEQKIEELQEIIITLNGRNKLTSKTIEAISFYYSHNIRIHDNVEDMKKGIQSILDHLTSTDDNPKHENCGDWCFMVQYNKRKKEAQTAYIAQYTARYNDWQEAKLKSNSKSFYSKPQYIHFEYKEPKPKHSSMNIRLCLNEDPMQLQRVQDIFTRLSNEELLKRCLDKWTTNYNEAFNSKLWQNLPKHLFFSFPMMEFAICQTILIYHLGYEVGNMLRVFDIPVREADLKHWNTAEKSRTKLRPSKQKKRRQTFEERPGQENYKKTRFCQEALNKSSKKGNYGAGAHNEF